MIDALVDLLTSDTLVNQLKDMVPVLIGAAIGFAGSLSGSILVNRRELVRRMRLQLYNELIPTAQKAVNDFLDQGLADDDPVTDQMVIVDRVARITGRKDRRLSKRAMEQWQEARKSYRATDSEGVYDNANKTVDRFQELSDRLGRKLS